jgi:signal transduction histidine kinase
VAAADEVRRRLARDLHDGAQQRFVLAAVWLKRAAARARGTPADEAFQQLQQGLAELRDLARGTHPARDAVRRSGDLLHRRRGAHQRRQACPGRPGSVTIDIAERVITAEIADHGIGGASTTAGSGLRGLADRLDALGGTLSIDSPQGGPTTIRAQAPLPPHP